MKTTIDLPDGLARRAKAHAARHRLTLRALVVRGLTQVLDEEAGRAPFTLRNASVGGNGLQPGFRDGDWAAVRAAAYEDRGG